MNDPKKPGQGADDVEDAVIVSDDAAEQATAPQDAIGGDAHDPETSAAEQADEHAAAGQPDAEPTYAADEDAPSGSTDAGARKAEPGMAPLIAAAAVGAVAALLLAPLAVNLLPYGAGSRIEAVGLAGAERDADVAARLEALEGALAERVEGLESRLSQVNKALADLTAADQQAEAARGAIEESVAETGQTARAVDGRVAALSAELEQGALTWRGEIEVLRRQLADLAAATPPMSVITAGEADAAGEGASVGQGVLTRLSLLEGGVRRLEARVNMLSPDALPETRPDARRLSEIETRINALERRPQVTAGGDAALGVAFASLAQAIAGSSPYAVEAATLAKVAGVTLPAAIADRAATGLPSKVALAADFDDAARDGLRALAEARAVDGAESWGGRLVGRLSSLVVIERTEETPGSEPEAILSRAEARIDEGDVAAALAEIEALPEPAREGMAPWIARAEARAAAEAAMVTLQAQLLGAGGGQ